MKKLFLLMVITTITASTFAQIGVQAGATIATIKTNDLPSDVSISSKVGFTLGILADIPISANFMFQPALNYTQKGAKAKEGSVELKRTLNYLELPLNFIYKATGGFFVGAGPALSYGLSGKDKFSDGSLDETIHFGSDVNNDDLKAFEFSGNVLAGFELPGGIFFTANYNFGFSNLSLETSGSLKNNYFGIRIGKKFGSSMHKK